MAVVRSPLMSLDARGKVAKAISFGHNRGRNVVRKVVKPKNPRSGLQTGMRASLTQVSQSFATDGATAKANWKAAGGKLKSLPLNSKVRRNQANVRRGGGVIKDPTLTSSGTEAAPTTIVYTALAKSVKITWVDSAGANDYATFIYMSTSTGFTPAPANLVAVIQHGKQTATIIRLTTGTPYYFVLQGSDYAGVLGTAAAQGTATPT